MASVANVVLTDGTTTKTYTPSSVDSNRVFSFIDRSLGQKALEGTLTVQSRNAGNDSQVVRTKLFMPHTVTNADTGVTSVVETSSIDIQVRHAAVSTDEEREFLISLLHNISDASQSLLLPVLQGDENLF